MALTYYPDLSHLGLLVVPTTGMKCGDGLHLHRGGIMPELAHALGFRPSEDGFVIPLSRHGTFEKSLTAVSLDNCRRSSLVRVLMPLATPSVMRACNSANVAWRS